MRDRLKRLFAKGVIWELLGIFILFCLTGSLRVSFVYVGIRICLYPIYHLAWKKIKLWKRKETNMFTLMITGFETQEEVNDFIEWYVADVTTLEKRIDGEATVIDINQIEQTQKG